MTHLKRLIGGACGVAVAVVLLLPAVTSAQWYLPVVYDTECQWTANGCSYTWKANGDYGWLLEDCGGYFDEPQIIYEGYSLGFCEED